MTGSGRDAPSAPGAAARMAGFTMRRGAGRLLSLLAAAGLAACADRGLLDPVPHDPVRVLTQSFGTLDAVSTRLFQLAESYATARDALLRDQMRLDVVLLGTAAAAVANPLFDGARSATLALGLGAGALTAGRTYFGGSARIEAYQGAYMTLACAGGLAAGLDGVRAAADPAALSDTLDRLIAEAAAHPARRPGRAEAEVLDAARARGLAARATLDVARRTLNGAPQQLRAFAAAAIRATTTRAVTGSMNFDAALEALRAQRAPGAAVPPQAAAGQVGIVAIAPVPPPARSVTDVVRELDAAATAANAFSARVAEEWGTLPACALRG